MMEEQVPKEHNAIYSIETIPSSSLDADSLAAGRPAPQSFRRCYEVDLPAEIRNEIYGYVLTGSTYIIDRIINRNSNLR